ncbi:hypothetical protein C0992_007002 [Termitomyces sp. T32_za158]|nr:hypothetical protein C0992_007002 [Termitomyces sp. T32_za158]
MEYTEQIIQLGSEETTMVTLYDVLIASRNFHEKPAPYCTATSTSTRKGKLDVQLEPVLQSIVPVPDLVENLSNVIAPELQGIFLPANSQFVAIVHPASTTLPFKRLHHLEKDNESQFEQENLAPVFKIMAYHLAFKQIEQETGTTPGYAAVFKRWASSHFQESSFRFFASSSKSTKNITDFGIYASLPVNANTEFSAESFAVKVVIEVKTTQVLTNDVFEDVTDWYQVGDTRYVPGLAIQYVWPKKASSNSTDDAGGAGQGSEQTRDQILRQIWGQLIQEKAEYAVLTTATASYYFYRRLDGSGDLYISPPYQTANNLVLYAWLSAAFEINGVNKDTIETPVLNKGWWDKLPTFEATGIRPA